MTPCRVIIADDEPLAVKLLESYCRRIDGIEVVGAYTSARQALQAIEAGGVDVAVLDIQMPEMNGIELARILDPLPVEVIFVTAFAHYAIEGFRVHAADYLLKPVSYDEFAAALQRVAGRRQQAAARRDCITVRSDYRQVRLDLEDILYVEGLKDYVKIVTISRERPVVTLMNLKNIEAMLPSERFVRIHRSYIAALDRIESFDRSGVSVGSARLPVGDTYRRRLLPLLSGQ